MKITLRTRTYKHLLLHIPHSSTVFPCNSPFRFEDLHDDEKQLIDYYTDELFAPDEESESITSVVFPYCRLCCDVERLVKDPLDSKGLGLFYDRPKVKRHVTEPLLGKREAFRLYSAHHAKAADILMDMGEGTLLIDCHSFSNFPNLLNTDPGDVDICIGYNDDETRPDKEVIGDIVGHFKSLGYKVGVNKPFSNSKTFAVPMDYHSIMIEVNKRLYMNEHTLEKTEGFTKLSHDIQSLYNNLLVK